MGEADVGVCVLRKLSGRDAMRVGGSLVWGSEGEAMAGAMPSRWRFRFGVAWNLDGTEPSVREVEALALVINVRLPVILNMTQSIVGFDAIFVTACLGWSAHGSLACRSVVAIRHANVSGNLHGLLTERLYHEYMYE